MRWVRATSSPTLEFPPADAELIPTSQAGLKASHYKLVGNRPSGLPFTLS